MLKDGLALFINLLRESRELDIDPEDPVSMAIARMQTYAWLLELILERVDPELRSD